MARRRFSQIERDALFEAADGKCQICGIELEDDWEADHVEPYSKGGKTHIINGQALCQKCNRTKGSKIVSQIELRPFQQEFLDKAVAKSKMQTDEDFLSLVVHAAAGSGKTLGSQVAADALIRRGFVEQVLILVPRLNLAQQYELDWTEMSSQLPWIPSMGPLLHRSNDKSRLIASNSSGYITTYQSLCANPQKHMKAIAKKPTLLILDEAHQLGFDEHNQDTSKSAHWVQQIGELNSVKMIFVMSGTPYRSDNKPLLFAKYGDPDENNYSELLADLEATYRDGVREQYLRRFEAQLARGGYEWTDMIGSTSTLEISDGDASVYKALQLPSFWQPLVDEFVEMLYQQKQISHQFSGLIACIHQSQANEVHQYLKRSQPQLKTLIAISQDGAKAHEALRRFKDGKHDVLITVSMAYVGYDHKPINTILLLTAIRSKGYLMQLVARGLRVIRDIEYNRQHCFVIAPDDPKMTEFVEFMRRESEAGYTERQLREPIENNKVGSPQMLGFADQGFISDLRAMGIDPTGDASPEDKKYADEIRRIHNLPFPVTEMLTIYRAMTGHSHFSGGNTVSEQTSRPRLTHAEQLAEAGSQLNKLVGRLAKQLCDVTVSSKEIGKKKRDINTQLWNIYGKSMKEVDTLAEIRDRATTVARWINQGYMDDAR